MRQYFRIFAVIAGVTLLFPCLCYSDSTLIENPSNSHWYLRVETKIYWHDAKDYCEAQGGYLATLTSQQENDFVYNQLCSPGHNYCLGGTDENTEGQWEWITGEPWEFTNWAPGQPDND